MSIMDFLGQDTALEAEPSPFPPALAGMMGGSEDMGPASEDAPEAAEGQESTLDILARMIEDAKLYIEAEQDEEDKFTMTKVLQTLQKYLAEEQKERDGAMQGKATPRMMRRAYGG